MNPTKTIFEEAGIHPDTISLPGDDSYVQQKLVELKTKPFADFSIEDLRFVLLHRIGHDVAVPIAIDRLSENVLAEGDLYQGDLLFALISFDDDYWERHAEHRNRFYQILHLHADRLQQEQFLPRRLKRSVGEFLSKWKN